jgi:hypothetical protein
MFMGRWPWILSLREKKQNPNRVRGVEVLSILARVKNAKKGNFLPKLHTDKCRLLFVYKEMNVWDFL